MDLAAYCVVAVLGLLIGSFLNVVVWRVPRGESIVSPPSACPACGHPVRPRDNVPVLSWLLLRGRCRDCQAPISPRYPVVEALTAVLFVLVLARVGVTWQLPAYLYLAGLAVALAAIDLDVRRLPDVLVLPAYPVTIGLLALASWSPGGEPDWAALLRGLVGGVGLLLAYFLMMLAYPRGMGFGDVKLSFVVGLALAWLGWGAFAVGAFAAFLLGGLFGLGLLLTGRAGRTARIPFGPWMLAGVALGIAAGEPLWDGYLSLLM